MKLMSRALVALTTLSMFSITLAGSTTPDKALEEIASYRQWTRINPKPLLVEFPSAGG
ncbi:MAG: hypothetical protein JWM21_513 [Acidobacteria bacterium]|nr:hypothetical protein [Acidobacteriota bacterium]